STCACAISRCRRFMGRRRTTQARFLPAARMGADFGPPFFALTRHSVPPHLTRHARVREPGPYASIAGDRPGHSPGPDRVSADIEYRPLVSHLPAFRLATGRAGFRYRPAHRDAARRPPLLRPRLGADYR